MKTLQYKTQLQQYFQLYNKIPTWHQFNKVYKSHNWKSPNTILNHFGSWNIALTQSGFNTVCESPGTRPTLQHVPTIEKICGVCNTTFLITKNQLWEINNQIKIGTRTHNNFFCSQSCATTYTNKHKKYGCRRSKLETIIESHLLLIYTHLNILFNQKDAIGSELDIYIPDLNIAIELNGIFHYKPIFGIDKLIKTQTNDTEKEIACINRNIKLHTIDTSLQSYVTEKTSMQFVNSVIAIINNTLQKS